MLIDRLPRLVAAVLGRELFKAETVFPPWGRCRRSAGFDCRTSRRMSNYIPSRSKNMKCAGMAKVRANFAADPASTMSPMSRPPLNGHSAARAPMA
jgi:hypothetical protein